MLPIIIIIIIVMPTVMPARKRGIRHPLFVGLHVAEFDYI